MHVTYRFPQTLSCRAADAKISTTFTFTTETNQTPRRVALEELPALVVEDFGEATGEEISRRYYEPLVTLLMFASGRQSELLKYELSTPIENKPEPLNVNCVFSASRAEKEPSKPLQAFQFLFTLRDVADRFELFMQTWFAFQEKHSDFTTLFFSYDYSKHDYLETRFLFLMLAVQCLIRDEYSESTSTSAFDTVRLQTLSQPTLSKQNQSELMVPSAIQLAFPTLFHDFILQRWSLLEKVIGTTQERFVKTVIANWHYVVHRGARTSDRFGGEKMYWLIERLSACVKLSMLRELGFSDDQVVQKLVATLLLVI